MKKMVTFVINDKVVQTHIVCVCVRVRVCMCMCVLGREGGREEGSKQVCEWLLFNANSAIFNYIMARTS
jgi:hypothetical protein